MFADALICWFQPAAGKDVRDARGPRVHAPGDDLDLPSHPDRRPDSAGAGRQRHGRSLSVSGPGGHWKLAPLAATSFLFFNHFEENDLFKSVILNRVQFWPQETFGNMWKPFLTSYLSGRRQEWELLLASGGQRPGMLLSVHSPGRRTGRSESWAPSPFAVFLHLDHAQV